VLYSFLDLGFGWGSTILEVETSGATKPTQIPVTDGFMARAIVEDTFGRSVAQLAARADDEDMVHFSSLLEALCRKGAWKGKNYSREMRSLLLGIQDHFEFALDRWKEVPLIELHGYLTNPAANGKKRHVSDVHYKEELMMTAQKAGAHVTCQRMRASLDAAGAQAAPNLSTGTSSSSTATVAPAGAARPNCTPAGVSVVWQSLALQPVVLGDTSKAKRDQTNYEWHVMSNVNASNVQCFPAGPVHVGVDGVQGFTSGEVNQYYCLAPRRPWAGVQELGCWTPIQEAVVWIVHRLWSPGPKSFRGRASGTTGAHRVAYRETRCAHMARRRWRARSLYSWRPPCAIV